MVLKPNFRHCVAEVQLFKWCQNLSAGTVLQRCSYSSGVETYLPALCCRGASVLAVAQLNCWALCCRGTAVKALLQPICWHCAAGVQLFKLCRNLSAGTVLQGCSCLSDVVTSLSALSCRGAKTYLQALCCRGAAV